MAKERIIDGPVIEDSTKGGDIADRHEQKMTAQQPTPASPNIVQGEPDWLNMAMQSYENSTDWMDSSVRGQWERNIRSFNSQHPAGSKYYSDAYKNRSKIFRPKTRAFLRQGEAAAAMSFFSNDDVISVTPIDDESPIMQASASYVRELLQYRLTSQNNKRNIPWYKLVIGAFQDASTIGVVCSKQWWEFVEVEETFGAFDENNMKVLDETGQHIIEKQLKVVSDRPRIDLYPAEQVRIDRGASWVDPIHTSPFVILLNPVYAGDLMLKSGRQTRDNTQWRDFSMSDLEKSTTRTAWDSTRMQREDKRQDPKESDIKIPEYKTVWAYENFMRWRGEYFVFWTAGTAVQLSEAVPVRDIYQHCDYGELPIVMGQALIETHKIYPAGKPQLVQELQREKNEVANGRLDNVKLALNKRYLVRRGRQVDLRQLTRSAPGSATLVTDKDDVVPFETRDVTQSSFQEQAVLDTEIDDIIGNFSPASIQNNRRLNETVGGMEMLEGSAQTVGEMDLRTFTETWAEPVLMQITRLEQVYESDLTVMTIAGAKAQTAIRFGVNEITDEILLTDMAVRVNVGLGATDPMKRIKKLAIAAETLSKMLGPGIATRINADEIIKEVMGTLGYRDGRRFFKPGPDPIVEMMQKQIAELQQQLERQTISADAKIKVAQITAFGEILEEFVKAHTAMQQGQQQAQIAGAEKDKDRQHDMRKTTMGHAAKAEGQKQSEIAMYRTELMKARDDGASATPEEEQGGTGPAEAGPGAGGQPPPMAPAA